MMQHSLLLWNCLHPRDVGAAIDRLRAISNRPYEFHCRKYVFSNTHFLLYKKTPSMAGGSKSFRHALSAVGKDGGRETRREHSLPQAFALQNQGRVAKCCNTPLNCGNVYILRM